MLARYLKYVNQVSVAAVLWSERRGFLYQNAPAAEILADTGTRAGMLASLKRSVGERIATTYQVSSGVSFMQFVMVPLMEDKNASDVVLAVEGDYAQLPKILHAIHSGSRYFSEIVHLLPHIVLTARPSGRFDYASRRWFEVTSTSRFVSDMHLAVLQSIDPRDANRFARFWYTGIVRLKQFSFEVRLLGADGSRWYELRAVPNYNESRLNKWIVALADVEEAVNTREALVHSRKRLNALVEAGRALIDVTVPPPILMRKVVQIMARALSVTCLAVYQDDNEKRHIVSYPAQEHELMGRLSELNEDIGKGKVLQREVCWEEGGVRPVLSTRLGISAGSQDLLVAIGAVGMPLFHEDDVMLFAEMAKRLSAALRSTEAYSRERRVAQVLQSSMLPVALPQPPGLSFDVTYRAADDVAVVGGDWYDAFELPNGKIVVLIGDVAGHGLEAAVVMGHVRENMRGAALEGAQPSEVLARVNRTVLAERCVMVTAFVGFLDPLTLSLEYANAGHPPPLAVFRDGRTSALEFCDVPLGIDVDTRYVTRARGLSDVEALVLYTDGLLEFDRDLIKGEARLRHVLEKWAASHFSHGAAYLADETLGGYSARDDIALLVVRFDEIARLDVKFPSTPKDARRARLAIERWLARASLEEERQSDFLLAVCEAVNNAVKHGSQEPSDLVRLSVTRDLAGVTALVGDSGKWQIHSSASEEEGKGMPIMRALSDEIEFDVNEKGSTVRIFVSAPEAKAL